MPPFFEHSGFLAAQLDSLLSDGREFLQGTPEPTYIDFVMATMLGLLTLHENTGGKAVEKKSKMKVSFSCHCVQHAHFLYEVLKTS